MNWVSIFSWNVRGLDSSINRNNVKRFIQSLNPSIVCLQESMCSVLGDNAKYSMGVFDSACWAEVSAEGNSGGFGLFLKSYDYTS